MTRTRTSTRRRLLRRSPLLAVPLAAALVLGGATGVSATPVPSSSGTTTAYAAPGTSTALSGLAVTGDPTDTIQTILSTDVGTLSISTTTGLTLAYANSWSGSASISFTGSQADTDTALGTASLTTAAGASGSTAHVGLTSMVAASGYNYLAPNQHFYQYVTSSGITWTAADTAAKGMSFREIGRAHV